VAIFATVMILSNSIFIYNWPISVRRMGSVAVQNRQAARLRLFLKLDCELHTDDCYHVGISNRKGAVGHVTCSDTITKDCIPKKNASVAMSGLEAYNYSGEAHYSSCYH
jgi:hypothetical protein